MGEAIRGELIFALTHENYVPRSRRAVGREQGPRQLGPHRAPPSLDHVILGKAFASLNFIP